MGNTQQQQWRKEFADRFRYNVKSLLANVKRAGDWILEYKLVKQTNVSRFWEALHLKFEIVVVSHWIRFLPIGLHLFRCETASTHPHRCHSPILAISHLIEMCGHRHHSHLEVELQL